MIQPIITHTHTHTLNPAITLKHIPYLMHSSAFIIQLLIKKTKTSILIDFGDQITRFSHCEIRIMVMKNTIPLTQVLCSSQHLQ